MLEAVINEGKAANEPHERLGNRLGVYLADTLASPNVTPPGGLNLTHQTLTEEHEAARRVKNTGDVLVCLGNPPYDRETKDEPEDTPRRKGGWVRYGDEPEGGADDENQAEKPILRDFTDPVSKMGHGVHAKNSTTTMSISGAGRCGDCLSAGMWRDCHLHYRVELPFWSSLLACGASCAKPLMSYGFDLGGDNLGARKTPNIFNIQTPVAIAVGIRGSKRNAEVPAKHILLVSKLIRGTRTRQTGRFKWPCRY